MTQDEPNENVLRGLTRLATRLAAGEAAGHVEYISKYDAAMEITQYVVDIHRDMQIIAAAETELLEACQAALAYIGGDGWDLTIGQHADNPLPTMLQDAITNAGGKV